MAVKKLPLKTFKSIYSIVPRLTIDLVIKSAEGIVLSKRDIPPAKGMWHLPGGTVYYSETHEQAARRIALDETGLRVKTTKLLGTIEYLPEKYSLGHATSIVYLVKITSGKLRGSFQAEQLDFFKSIPKNTIPEAAKFLKLNLASLLKS